MLGRVKTLREDAVVMSLDARMAFDTVEWPYMFTVLEKMGFVPNFTAWLSLLYTDPIAQVVVNNRTSQRFPLRRGTRQGCPLSPLIFTLMLEPLATWVQRDPLIRGLRWTDSWEARISLYADDILLYLASPKNSIHRVLNIFTNFGRYSGYIN